MDLDVQKTALLIVLILSGELSSADESFLISCISSQDPDTNVGTSTNPFDSVSLDDALTDQSRDTLKELNHNRTYYIFTVPPSGPQRDCSGTVDYIELCFRQFTNSQDDVALQFLSLNNSNTTDVPLKVKNQSCMTFESTLGEEATTASAMSDSRSRKCGLLCKAICFIFSCGDNSDATEPSVPSDVPTIMITVCCVRAVPISKLTIPSSEIAFRINPSDRMSIGGFMSFSNYSIYNCSTLDNCTPIPYVPFLRFYIDDDSTVSTDGKPTTQTTQATPDESKTSEGTDAGNFTPTVNADKTETNEGTDSNLVLSTETMTGVTVPERSEIGTALAGGVIGGIVAVASIISIVIVVVLIAAAKLKSVKERDDNETLIQGLTLDNAVYDEVPRDDQEDTVRFPSVAYAGIDVAYAETRVVYSKPHKNRKNYVAPAKDEMSLYVQLKDINTLDLRRDLITLGAELGSGQFGVVYRGELANRQGEAKVVAVKTLKEGAKEEERIKFLQEATIMGQFKHPNVISMYGIVTDGEPILLVLEFLERGDLSYFLRSEESRGIQANEHTLLGYCRQVAYGMAYLSNKAFVHRDLAARNILVSDNNICKIADFGMSRDLMEGSYYVSRGGVIPVKWTAPEALHYKKYSTASDVWSYGVVMYEIWSLGHKPYEGYRNDRAIGMISEGYRLAPPPGCPRAIYRIMIQCWHPEVSARPIFQAVGKKLSLPDEELLKWLEEDKAVHPEAAKLGADLLSAQELYKDLQTTYSHHNHLYD